MGHPRDIQSKMDENYGYPYDLGNLHMNIPNIHRTPQEKTPLNREQSPHEYDKDQRHNSPGVRQKPSNPRWNARCSLQRPGKKTASPQHWPPQIRTILWRCLVCGKKHRFRKTKQMLSWMEMYVYVQYILNGIWTQKCWFWCVNLKSNTCSRYHNPYPLRGQARKGLIGRIQMVGKSLPFLPHVQSADHQQKQRPFLRCSQETCLVFLLLQDPSESTSTVFRMPRHAGELPSRYLT